MEERLLISGDQIRRISREQGLTAGVVEKDYALTWLLKGLYSNDSKLKKSFVLKGGTAIRKVYFPETWRFSDDLDFTVVGDKDQDRIRQSLEEVFASILSESAMRYSFESFHQNPGAIIANVQFLGPLNFTNRIKHDITLNERMVLDPESRVLKSNYADLHDFKVRAYSLTEIVVEKIRSIVQRGYSRDYYDVWRLTKEGKFRKSEVKWLLVKKCELSGVDYEPKLLFSKERLGEARSHWEPGLGYLTKKLPDFETVIKELKEALAFLKD